MTRSSSAQRAHNSGEAGEREYFNPWRESVAAVPMLISRAHDARVEAALISETAPLPVNHRDFFVGGAALAVHPETRSTRIEAAHNSYPREGGSKVCAEKRVFARIDKDNKRGRDARNFWVPILQVEGEPQADGATGAKTETLWPCGELCWGNEVMKKMPADGLILTVRPDRRLHQVQTVQQMDDFYKATMRGDRPAQPPLMDTPETEWGNLVHEYDDMYPKDIDALASPENRQLAVVTAIQVLGGSLRHLRAL